ncbi:hypothetical protein BV20DRAFT_462703 [Pilatotrama ljubarskyi]|nr:hypothetical protein BV20DRAFT_462703 [Pilatotrama ljubarskyi]
MPWAVLFSPPRLRVGQLCASRWWSGDGQGQVAAKLGANVSSLKRCTSCRHSHQRCRPIHTQPPCLNSSTCSSACLIGSTRLRISSHKRPLAIEFADSSQSDGQLRWPVATVVPIVLVEAYCVFDLAVYGVDLLKKWGLRSLDCVSASWPRRTAV